MQVSVIIPIFSHLNDAAIDVSIAPLRAKVRMQFVKFLLNRYSDTNERVNIDQEWDMFLTEHTQYADMLEAQGQADHDAAQLRREQG